MKISKRKFPTRPEVIEMAKKTILRLHAEGQHERANNNQKLLNEFYPEQITEAKKETQ
jgi:hypothetical protein